VNECQLLHKERLAFEFCSLLRRAALYLPRTIHKTVEDAGTIQAARRVPGAHWRRIFENGGMSIRHSTRLSWRHVLMAAFLAAACGSDYGGELDAGGGAGDASADARSQDTRSDVADVSVRDLFVGDVSAPMDTGATADNVSPDARPPDGQVPPDVTTADSSTPGEASTPGDGPAASDTPGSTDGLIADNRGDALVSGDSTTDGVDATIDGPIDASIDVRAPDVTDTGSGSDRPTGSCNDPDCSTCTVDEGGDPDPCTALTGNASDGPAAGTPNSQLCRETLDCYHQTGCDGTGAFICYCGTAIDQTTCNSATTIANPGPCKTQMDRSLEVASGSPGSIALGRIQDDQYAGGHAGITAAYETGSCRNQCRPYTCAPPGGGDAGSTPDARPDTAD
jgi:hypothetical protein